MSSFLFRLFHFTQMVFDKLKLNPSFSILDQQEHPLGYIILIHNMVFT